MLGTKSGGANMAACSLVTTCDVMVRVFLLHESFLLAIQTMHRVMNAMKTKLAHMRPTTVSRVPAITLYNNVNYEQNKYQYENNRQLWESKIRLYLNQWRTGFELRPQSIYGFFGSNMACSVKDAQPR